MAASASPREKWSPHHLPNTSTTTPWAGTMYMYIHYIKCAYMYMYKVCIENTLFSLLSPSHLHLLQHQRNWHHRQADGKSSAGYMYMYKMYFLYMYVQCTTCTIYMYNVHVCFSVQPTFGFIICCERNESIFFHFSQYSGNSSDLRAGGTVHCVIQCTSVLYVDCRKRCVQQLPLVA